MTTKLHDKFPEVHYTSLPTTDSGSTGSSSSLTDVEERVDGTFKNTKKADRFPNLERTPRREREYSILSCCGLWKAICDLFACIFCCGRRRAERTPVKSYQELIEGLEKRNDSIDEETTDLLDKIKQSIGYTIARYRAPKDNEDLVDLKKRLEILLFNYCNLIELMKKKDVQFDQAAAYRDINSLCDIVKIKGVDYNSIIRVLNKTKSPEAPATVVVSSPVASSVASVPPMQKSPEEIRLEKEEKTHQARAKKIKEIKDEIASERESFESIKAKYVALLEFHPNILMQFETLFKDQPEKLMKGLEEINYNILAFIEISGLISSFDERVEKLKSSISGLSGAIDNDSTIIEFSESEEAEFEEIEDQLKGLKKLYKAAKEEFSFQSIRINALKFSGKIAEILDKLEKSNPEGRLSDWIKVLQSLKQDEGDPITVPISKLSESSKVKFKKELDELKSINGISGQYAEVSKQLKDSTNKLTVMSLLKRAKEQLDRN